MSGAVCLCLLVSDADLELLDGHLWLSWMYLRCSKGVLGTLVCSEENLLDHSL